MRVTARLNLKGGVAKTTTASNLAAILAVDQGKRVLSGDGGSRGSGTEFFGASSDRGSVATILRRGGNRAEPGPYAAGFIRKTEYEGLDILPADDSLMDLDLSKCESGAVDAGVLRRLAEFVADRYDYMIFDCPPAFNAAGAAALIAADDVVIPIKLDAFSLRGMGNLLRQIRNMQRINPRLKLAGLLPTMWYRDDKIAESEATLKEAGLPMYPHIRRSNTVDAMTYRQEPLLVSSPTSGAGVDYRKFVRAYLGVTE